MRKAKFKKYIKILLFIIILIIVSILILNNQKVENNIVQTPKTEYEITNVSESDTDVINTIFADGMNVEDYKSLYNNIPIKIDISGEYIPLEYDFEKVLHYSEIEEYINDLSKSTIVNSYIIGKSVDNRNIYNVEVGNGKKVLMIDSNIHAAEGANTPMLLKFLIDIVNQYNSGNEKIIKLLNDVKIAAILCINPDGYEVFNFGIESINNKELWIYQNKDSVNINNFKYNANGVDLNRNFPTQNAGLYYKSEELISSVSLTRTTKKLSYFGGEVLGSEPETKAVMYQILTHYKDAYAYINLHNQGRVIYSGKPNLSNEYNENTINMCNKIGEITGYKVHGLSREEVGEGNDGTASDFVAELANGFVFSTKTGRLSSSKYIDNNCSLKYNVPAIVVETTKDYHRDPKYFKDEYYNHGVKEALFSLLEYNSL
jgi:g-D-glutamyl-meso-diaminopimelate peptidase